MLTPGKTGSLRQAMAVLGGDEFDQDGGASSACL